MRIIDITESASIELWPGRRLFLPSDSLIALPKGAMRIDQGTTESSLYFGGVGKTTVQVVGKPPIIRALFDSVTEMERPDAAVRL